MRTDNEVGSVMGGCAVVVGLKARVDAAYVLNISPHVPLIYTLIVSYPARHAEIGDEFSVQIHLPCLTRQRPFMGGLLQYLTRYTIARLARQRDH